MSDPLVVVAAVVGALAGAVSFMFRQLVTSKNRRINELLDERDYWRQVVLSSVRLPDGSPIPDFGDWYDREHPTKSPRAGRESYVRPGRETD